ncbi:etoposide-induced protein 2.4 homolog [Vanessa tameamea]|uniref:Etoposide-induced protein 2.4 homolog n=1 Tax=Vanessa tameamea TaxID=334116 RepID=A0A8B8IWF5_VANTA|nr:etoposide-induced protein 2.4 homolog [Vanessa tameamea]XP_046962338.1 etoposide-induced protein 2.4 homolog [Vanessa cardui]
MESVTNFCVSLIKGFIDSLRGVTVLLYLDREINERALSRSPPADFENSKQKQTKVKQESKVLTRVLQSCILNGFIFLLSILIFEYGLLPAVKYLVILVFGHNPGVAHNVWGWMQPFLSMTFRMIWVLPLFLLSKLVNSLWFQDIADSAYRHRRGRPQFMSSVSKIIADSLFSLLVQALFLVQSMLVSMLPITYIGELLCLVHMCLLYSLYSFEYKWFNMGWELHKRLTFIETNWPYFLGFGLPLAVLTQIPQSYIISGCVFSIFFPVFILSGNEATPVTGSECPLRLFSGVVALANGLFRLARRRADDT